MTIIDSFFNFFKKEEKNIDEDEYFMDDKTFYDKSYNEDFISCDNCEYCINDDYQNYCNYKHKKYHCRLNELEHLLDFHGSSGVKLTKIKRGKLYKEYLKMIKVKNNGKIY